MTKTQFILTQVSGVIIAPLHTDENKGSGKARHNCDVARREYVFNATEFLLNNTVYRLIQSQGYKDGYKLVTTCKASEMSAQIERVKIFVNICKRMNAEGQEFDGIITFAEEALIEFAEEVDGVTIDRATTDMKYWHQNPAMKITGTL